MVPSASLVSALERASVVVVDAWVVVGEGAVVGTEVVGGAVVVVAGGEMVVGGAVVVVVPPLPQLNWTLHPIARTASDRARAKAITLQSFDIRAGLMDSPSLP
jgi:hypothetical protein